MDPNSLYNTSELVEFIQLMSVMLLCFAVAMFYLFIIKPYQDAKDAKKGQEKRNGITYRMLDGVWYKEKRQETSN